jgi:hypothetical protein
MWVNAAMFITGFNSNSNSNSNAVAQIGDLYVPMHITGSQIVIDLASASGGAIIGTISATLSTDGLTMAPVTVHYSKPGSYPWETIQYTVLSVPGDYYASSPSIQYIGSLADSTVQNLNGTMKFTSDIAATPILSISPNIANQIIFRFFKH